MQRSVGLFRTHARSWTNRRLETLETTRDTLEPRAKRLVVASQVAAKLLEAGCRCGDAAVAALLRVDECRPALLHQLALDPRCAELVARLCDCSPRLRASCVAPALFAQLLKPHTHALALVLLDTCQQLDAQLLAQLLAPMTAPTEPITFEAALNLPGAVVLESLIRKPGALLILFVVCCQKEAEKSTHTHQCSRVARLRAHPRSPHPYRKADEVTQVQIFGASQLEIAFDARSKFVDGDTTVSLAWTGSDPLRYSQDYPGTGGRPAQRVDTDGFQLHFRSDGYRGGAFGYKLVAYATQRAARARASSLCFI